MSAPPDFVLVGAMKAGSTTLHRQLERHPQLFLTRPKEPEYWSLRFGEPGAEAWYQGLFREARPGQLRGEASTGYTRWPQIPQVPERLAAHRPDVRLVYALRDPVERAVSHWRHRMLEWQAEGREALPIAEAIEVLPEILDSSRYLRQIERYLAHFAREQLHVVFFEDLTREPAPAFDALQRFLGVAPDPAVGARRLHANRPGDLQARQALVARLRRLQALPAAGLARRLLPERVRARLTRRLLDSRRAAALARPRPEAEAPLPPVEASERRLLAARLAAETAELAAWLGRELPFALPERAA